MNPISVITHSGIVKINIEPNTTAEDVIIEVCKNFKIGPIARHLFALRSISTKAWLNLSVLIDEILKKDFEFKVRFNVPDANRLKDIDLIAYDFYFKQVRDGVLFNKIPDIDYNKYKSEIIGLSVVDMKRAMVDDGLTKEEVIRDYKQFIPQKIRKKHSIFVKKPVINKLNEIIKLKVDALFVKSGYLEQFKKIVPNYLSEDFNALMNDTERHYSVIIRVNPYNTTYPGISMKYEHKDEWEHICSIDDLCYLNIRKEGTVEISRKNGIPLYLRFHSLPDMTSFVSLLDGYYRLTVKWIFNLCRDLPTPSLLRLLPLRCHGPVSGQFAYRKLEEKRNNKVGSFILRESDLAYNAFYIDVCTKNSSKPVTYKIIKTNNKQYRLCSGEITYSTIPQLISDYRSGLREFLLQECLPPSEFDQSNLLICQTKEDACTQASSTTKKELPTTKPVFIDTRTLMVFKNKPKDGRCPFTAVYRSVWSTDNDKKNVAIKVLKENFKEKYLTEFLSLTSRWAFVNSNAVVKFYGLTLSNPISMVMEYLPLGQLDLYLADVDSRPPIKEVDLVEASTYLANALWYLEEAGFVHGSIRCRKLLVSSHTDNSFVVKLTDPGLHNEFTDTDVHWIPPEHYNDPSQARSSVMTDVWAFGTTLWEIFSYGKAPPSCEAHVLKKFYKCGKTLPQPHGCPNTIYTLMMECWNHDPYCRKKPQEAMRDVNQILYQVYNARQGHKYTAIIPTHNHQQDNISNKSKESDDMSSSLFSELTLNTFLDDGDEVSSGDLSPSGDMYPKMNDFTQMYCRHVDDSSFMMPFVNQQDYNFGDNAISSMQSIFELDDEWKLILTGRIGEGFYGEVYKGMLQHWHDEEDSQSVAVKKLKPHTLTHDKLEDFDREISIMKKLEHPNIVRIKGIIRDPDMCLVLEYIENGSLRSYLNIHREQLTVHHLLKFALDVAKGMAYLSEKKIVHRDLAARNILVVNEHHVKISDFGLAQFIGNKEYYQFQTARDLPIEWYAPESIEFGKFSPQSDVWSYGVTLYEMFSRGEHPRLPIRQEQTADNICKALRNEIRLQCPPKCPLPIYQDIMQACWEYEAKDRPTFVELGKMIENLFKPSDESYEMHLPQ